jgi:cell division protein FtsA
VKGAAELAREVLGMPVKIGIPGGFNAGLVREIENPIYATCVGLVLHGLRNKETMTLNLATGKNGGSLKKVLHKMKSWFDEL